MEVPLAKCTANLTLVQKEKTSFMLKQLTENSFEKKDSWGFCQKSCQNHPTNFSARYTPSEISGLKIVPSETCEKFLDKGLNFDADFDICVAKNLNYTISATAFKVGFL